MFLEILEAGLDAGRRRLGGDLLKRAGIRPGEGRAAGGTRLL